MRTSLIFVLICLFLNISVSASDEISISTPSNHINLITLNGVVHVRIKVKFQNHKDNRKIRLDWESGASERQLNNLTDKDYDGTRPYEIVKEGEYIIYTDEDFIQTTYGVNGLLLSQGEYHIEATLTRKVGGKDKEFRASVDIVIGEKEGK